MRICTRNESGVTVITPSGNISQGGENDLVRAVEEALQRGARKLVIDLGRVNYMDSSGVGATVSFVQSVGNVGGTFCLVNLQPKVRDLMSMAQLLTVFQIEDTVNAGIQSLC